MQKETSSSPSDQPLSLSVHDLPDVSSQGELIERQGGRWMVWLVLLVCAAPVMLSYLTYYVIRPQAKSVHGELIEPTRALPDVKALEADGRALNLMDLKGQWLFISVGSGACEEACQARLFIQRQLIVSLGKEQDRVEWVWLIRDQSAIPEEIKPGLAQAHVLRVSKEALDAWLPHDVIKAGQQDSAGTQSVEDYFYLVDPMGELMERFKAGADKSLASGVKKDLERLLRASSSWDKAGR
jgi:cytochrome oxidase Cu insertion factor (SCO1/SenC/PrrC family)